MQAKAPSKAEILELEASYWDAMKAKDGAKTAELSADPAVVTGARGVMSIPKKKMAAMTEEGAWELLSYDFENVEVSIPTPDIAIIAYTVRQKVRMNGKEQEMHAADSSTWLRGKDGWQCHAHSETMLQPDKVAA